MENAALHYLQRYATSSENLRRVLTRKIDRSCRHHGDAAADFTPLLDTLIARYQETGLLNDAGYAQAKAASLRRQGKSRQAIAAKLKAKGLGAPDIGQAIATADQDRPDDDPEFQAALTLARRKKLGPYRPGPAAEPDQRRRDMGTLARAGFSFEIARRVLEFRDEEFQENVYILE